MLISYVLLALVFAFGVLWLWPEFVEQREPPRTRTVLHFFLALETAIELSLWAGGVLKPWMLIVILVCNLWGMLDAFLRFPVVHDFDSLFGLKQSAMVVGKLIGYAVGFRNIGRRPGWFILSVICCVFLLPILWFIALPIGDVDSYHQKHDVVDVDLMVRLWQALFRRAERAAAVAHLRMLARKGLLLITKVVPWLRPLVIRKDPSFKQLLRIQGCSRSV